MSEEWLSESNVKGSKSLIVLGYIGLETLHSLSQKYSSGVLWICSNSNTNKLPDNIKKIDPSCAPRALTKFISDFLSLNYQFVPSVKVSKEIYDHPEHNYSQILDLIVSQINSAMRARKTRSENGFIRQNQVFLNFAGYLSKRLPKDWSTIGEGCLAIVVGAGPSLDITLPLIKNGLNRPIIVATDSSLTALKNADLNPDFVISIDPEKSYESCSLPGYTPGIAVLSTQSHPSWAKQWGNSCCYMSGRVVTEDWLAQRGIVKTKLLAINNAGLTALAFADFINTSAILTIGLDLAGGNHGEQRYAEITNRSHIQTISTQYHKIPGNYETTVPTPFLSDWEETSNYCQEISKRKMLINLNDRGAKLSGANLIHPDQIDELKNALCENILSYSGNNPLLLEQRKKLVGHGLSQLLSTITELCDRCWFELNKINSSDSQSMLNFLRKTLADKDFASLMGDFSFATIPIITSDQKPSVEELNNLCNELKSLLWRLEDAIVETHPSEEFLVRFFTEKFN